MGAWEKGPGRRKSWTRKARGHPTLEGVHHSLEPPAFHALHHPLHFEELLEQPVHVLHFHPGATGDSAAARAVNNPRIAPLPWGHRVDDGDLPAHLTVSLIRRNRPF